MMDWLGPSVSEYSGGTEGGCLAMIEADQGLDAVVGLWLGWNVHEATRLATTPR